MKLLQYTTITFLLILTATSKGQEKDPIKTQLQAHGILTTAEGMTTFLEKGWAAAQPPSPLPQQPRQKATLLSHCWHLLALQHEKTRQIPGLPDRLHNLAKRYAAGDFPTMVSFMVEEDISTLDMPKAQAKKIALERLQYNGMLALGIFGKPTPEARKLARKLYTQNNHDTIRMLYARTLAMLGDRHILDEIVTEITKANRISSVAASKVLWTLLETPTRLTPNMAIQVRNEKAQEIAQWWKEKKQSFLTVNRKEAIERMQHRQPDRAPQLRTLRDLLRASAQHYDITNKKGSRTAYDQLQQMGTALLPHLQPIVQDEREDLDIRTEAIRWYTRLQQSDAKRVLKHLRKDPNPEIATLARDLLATL